jgi:hypothetical protein
MVDEVRCDPHSLHFDHIGDVMTDENKLAALPEEKRQALQAAVDSLQDAANKISTNLSDWGDPADEYAEMVSDIAAQIETGYVEVMAD